MFECVIETFPPERARPLWELWSRYEYQYGDLESTLKLGKRVSETYPNGKHYFFSGIERIRMTTLPLKTLTLNVIIDPPIKLFAQRHICLGIDAIAARDLGAAYARRHIASSVATIQASSQERSTTRISQSLTAGGSQNAGKRPASPDRKCGAKREEKGGLYGGRYEGGYKRVRAGSSPVRADRDVLTRDRDRWALEGRSTPIRGTVSDRDIKREQPASTLGQNQLGAGGGVRIPPIISWFIGELPPVSLFDGLFL